MVEPKNFTRIRRYFEIFWGKNRFWGCLRGLNDKFLVAMAIVSTASLYCAKIVSEWFL